MLRRSKAVPKRLTVKTPNKMKPLGIDLRPFLPALMAISATLFGASAIAQTWGCFTPPSDPSPPALGLACGSSIEYAPLIPDQTPIKYCRIAFHVFQKDDSTGNFPNNSEGITYLTNLANTASDLMGQLDVLNLGATSPYLQDARIRFVLDAIYFHPHTVDWNYTSPSSMYTKYVTNDYDGYGMTSDEKLDVEHIFLSGNPTAPTGGATYGVGMQGYISEAGFYNHYLNNGPTSWNWGAVRNLVHELCHSMSLSHNFQNCYYCPSTGAGPVNQCDVCSDDDPPGQNCPDVGTSNNYMDYYPGGYNMSNPNPGLSACQIGRMHYYLDGNAGTISRIVVQDYCTYDPNATITINQDVTWSSSKKLKGDLVIDPGATLTIKCRVHMPAGGKIIVKQGARLIVDEGEITNLCGDFWAGIQAWGTTDQNQSGNPIPTHQALVVLKNGAMIEHAREAISMQEGGVWGTYGGVVQATDAQFLNCRRSVEFLSYQNTTPGGQPIANRSFFNHCEFIVDTNYRGGNDFYAHVSMWAVNGIGFSGCHFKNLQTTITQSDKLGQGIISIDAQYTVSGACSYLQQPYGVPCPSAYLTRSTFEGLDHGIDASVSSTDRSFSVTDCDFTDNVIGVYSKGVNSFHVFKSNFTGGGRQVSSTGSIDPIIVQSGGHHGIFSTGSHGFRIEENSFVKSTGANTDFTGTRINFSGEYNSEVYKNTATNTDQAFVGEGKCIDETQAAYVGLQFLCNGNNNPDGQDIFDRKVGSSHNNHSIRTQQGSSSTPAGNTFTQETVPMDESDFKNNTDWVLNYWYNNSTVPTAKPLDYTPGWVGITYTTHTNGCPSHLDVRQPQRYTEADMAEVRAEFAAAKTAYVNTAYTYNALLDGGNTDALINEVQESWPQDAWQLHDALMSKSPYLTPEVLRSVVEKNVMPQAMLLEVLLANPDGTKKEGLIKWLQYDSPWPLPQYMIDLIVGSWNQKTFRTQLESDMGQHHADMSFAADELIGEWKNDTLSINTDSILTRWQQVPSLGARYSEALTRLERGEYSEAQNLMIGLDATFKLSDEQRKEREDAVAYITVLATAHGTGHDLMHLDGTALAALRNIAAMGCERPALWAQNILCFGYGECYAPCTGEGASQKALQLPRSVPPTAAPSPLSIYPNPATSYVTLSYKLADAPQVAVLLLRGVDGRELRRMPLSAQRGQQLLDTRSYAPGTYSVELLNNGERIATERLVLKP